MFLLMKRRTGDPIKNRKNTKPQNMIKDMEKYSDTVCFRNLCFDTSLNIAGLVGFMGNGDLWGLIFTHKSLSRFMGINGDLWGFMDRPRIL